MSIEERPRLNRWMCFVNWFQPWVLITAESMYPTPTVTYHFYFHRCRNNDDIPYTSLWLGAESTCIHPTFFGGRGNNSCFLAGLSSNLDALSVKSSFPRWWRPWRWHSQLRSHSKNVRFSHGTERNSVGFFYHTKDYACRQLYPILLPQSILLVSCFWVSRMI